ncbi:CpaF family protein, partial [Mesorhizobium sp. M00.F.Ca.ET.158.01.1.1]
MLGRFIKGPSEQRVLQTVPGVPTPNGALPSAAVETEAQSDDFLSLKVDLHRHLIDRFNLTALENASKDEILNEIRPIVREFVRSHSVPLNARELDQITSETADEMLGLGPIEPLLKDDTITDILI